MLPSVSATIPCGMPPVFPSVVDTPVCVIFVTLFDPLLAV